MALNIYIYMYIIRAPKLALRNNTLAWEANSGPRSERWNRTWKCVVCEETDIHGEEGGIAMGYLFSDSTEGRGIASWDLFSGLPEGRCITSSARFAGVPGGRCITSSNLLCGIAEDRCITSPNIFSGRPEALSEGIEGELGLVISKNIYIYIYMYIYIYIHILTHAQFTSTLANSTGEANPTSRYTGI
jgi:hypothetical protein